MYRLPKSDFFFLDPPNGHVISKVEAGAAQEADHVCGAGLVCHALAFGMF